LSKISSQYTWINYLYGSVCRISCAARSFLTIDPATRLVVCKRDKSLSGKYWNNVTNSAGQMYPDYCIPKLTLDTISSSLACNQISADLFRTQCSSMSQPSSYAGKGYDCCYSSSSLTSQLAELFDFNASAANNQNVILTTLVQSEP
jgi:hypothetical protein